MTTTDTFENWMRRVDAVVTARAGVSVHDLPDMSFRDWYDEGITPGQAARLVLEDAL